MTYKLIIVDNHLILCDGFKSFLSLQISFEEILEVEKRDVFIKKLIMHNPGLSFVYINMPVKDGFEAIKEALEFHLVRMTLYNG